MSWPARLQGGEVSRSTTEKLFRISTPLPASSMTRQGKRKSLGRVSPHLPLTSESGGGVSIKTGRGRFPRFALFFSAGDTAGWWWWWFLLRTEKARKYSPSLCSLLFLSFHFHERIMSRRNYSPSFHLPPPLPLFFRPPLSAFRWSSKFSPPPHSKYLFLL